MKKYLLISILKSVTPHLYNTQLEKGTVSTSYVPYGQGSTEIKVENSDKTQELTYVLPIQQEMLKGDVFSKELDGWKELHNWQKIDSYNGENITTDYISTTGSLTTGATVFYKLQTPKKIPCTEEQSKILNQLNALDLFEGINDITTTENIALLQLKYVSNVDEIDILEQEIEKLNTTKVDKVPGKGLSTEDYTTEEKQKLAGLTNYDDTEIKEDIAKIQEEQTTQNQKIEKIEDNQIHIATEQSSTINVQDCSNLSAKIDVFGVSEQETRSGKNKFDIDSFKDISFVLNGTGEITDDYINVIATEENITYTNNVLQNVDSILPEQYRKYCSELVEGENVFSFKFENKSTNKLASVYYNLLNENYKAINQIYRLADDTNVSGKLSVTINNSNAKYLYPRFDACVGGNVVYSEIMVAQDLTEYEKYGASPSPKFPSEIENVVGDIDITIENEDKSQSQIITFPLQENQKFCEKDYLASNGIHHVLQFLELQGTETFTEYNSTIYNPLNICAFKSQQTLPKNADTSLALSTHFSLKDLAQNNINPEANKFSYYTDEGRSDNGLYFFINYEDIGVQSTDTSEQKIEKFKNWLVQQKTNNTSVIVGYGLSKENEVIEPYTEAQQEAYNQLQNVTPYKLVTNISTDKAKLQFNYIADTKTYIDNKVTNTQKQLNTINELLSTANTSAMLLDNLQTDLESEVL